MKHVRIPTVYRADTLLDNWPLRAVSRDDDGIASFYVLARPLSWQARGPYTWWLRLKAAWLVFTGQCDALKWYDQ